MFLLSLDEVDRVRRLNRIQSNTELAERTGISRKTWSHVLRTRSLSPSVLNALAELGANPSRVLVFEDHTKAAA